MLIDGELVRSGTGRTFDNLNPATEEVVGSVPDVDATDLERSVGAARRAFDTTDRSTNVELRRRCLTQLREALQSDVETPPVVFRSGTVGVNGVQWFDVQSPFDGYKSAFGREWGAEGPEDFLEVKAISFAASAAHDIHV
jgi:acyl-CoA reductase-like NAD-dependent aldehyde dehydrogenase